MSFLEEAKKESEKTKQELRNRRERERQETLARVSEQCLSIAKNLKEDILAEAHGKTEDHFGYSVGYLKYRIMGKNNEAEYFFMGEKEEIESTEGFRILEALCIELGLKISIQESESGIKDQPNWAWSLYFLDIEVSGW